MTKEEFKETLNNVAIADEDFWLMLNNQMETLISIFAIPKDSQSS